jgi:proteic killer suppression protein
MYGHAVHIKMKIGRIRHKGLRRFYEDDDPAGLPAAWTEKIRDILTAIEFAGRLDQVQTVPGWRLHPLRGARSGAYAIVVSRNWRITFRVDGQTVTDFEDYH